MCYLRNTNSETEVKLKDRNMCVKKLKLKHASGKFSPFYSMTKNTLIAILSV